jgi:hypothetical protein
MMSGIARSGSRSTASTRCPLLLPGRGGAPRGAHHLRRRRARPGERRAPHLGPGLHQKRPWQRVVRGADDGAVRRPLRGEGRADGHGRGRHRAALRLHPALPAHRGRARGASSSGCARPSSTSPGSSPACCATRSPTSAPRAPPAPTSPRRPSPRGRAPTPSSAASAWTSTAHRGVLPHADRRPLRRALQRRRPHGHPAARRARRGAQRVIHAQTEAEALYFRARPTASSACWPRSRASRSPAPAPGRRDRDATPSALSSCSSTARAPSATTSTAAAPRCSPSRAPSS